VSPYSIQQVADFPQPPPEFESLSPAKIHRKSFDVARGDPLAVTRAGFEPPKIGKGQVRQICRANLDARSAVPRFSEGRANVPSREQSLSLVYEQRSGPRSHGSALSPKSATTHPRAQSVANDTDVYLKEES
jgi:hypothetical protein